ncbi:MAG: phosphodiester glycosidase family protein [Armatimonadetes bacterium]|nr:phosphodiester glycosidase family protein [Armatimonadota bacterium]
MKKVILGLIVAAALLGGASQVSAATLIGTLRDFCAPDIVGACTRLTDFEGAISGLATGMVSSTLSGGLPAFVAPDGTAYITVVDGRRPGHSFGMTAVEFAMEMRRHGVVDAVHLDGGGSATLVVRGRVVNRPSDAGGERAVADALLLFSRDR